MSTIPVLFVYSFLWHAIRDSTPVSILPTTAAVTHGTRSRKRSRNTIMTFLSTSHGAIVVIVVAVVIVLAVIFFTVAINVVVVIIVFIVVVFIVVFIVVIVVVVVVVVVVVFIIVIVVTSICTHAVATATRVFV